MSRASRGGAWAVRSVHHPISRASRFAVEELERRTLLTSVLTPVIPLSIDPTKVPQQLFADGRSTFTQNTLAGFKKADSQFYRFAVDNSGTGEPTTFSTSVAVPDNIDTALALYDADGNLIVSLDSDNPDPSAERLSVPLDSGKQYELGVFTANIFPPIPQPPAQPVTVTVDLPPQVHNTPLKIDPTTGILQFQANSGEDQFNNPADVDYYPLDFTNGGPTGTVTLKPSDPSEQFFGALYRFDTTTGSWREVSSGAGGAVTLNVVPPAQGEVTDASYELAISPQNFNSPALAYEIDLSAPVLGPATVSPLGQPAVPTPTAVGTAEYSTQQFFLNPEVIPFRSISGAPMTVTLTTSSSPPLLSIYDGTSNTVIFAEASATAGAVTVTLNPTPGQVFVARVGSSNNATGGTFNFDVKQDYTPTPIAVTNALGQTGPLSIGPDVGGQFFRLTPPDGSDFLVLELTPPPGSNLSPQITAIASGLLPAVQRFGSTGQSVLVPIDLRGVSGPVDVYVALNGVGGGSGTATLSYAALTIPKQLPLSAFPLQTLDVQTGGLSASVPAPTFGKPAGVKFYEFAPGANQTFTAQASGGAAPLLVRYKQDGGIFRLDDSTLPPIIGPDSLTADVQGTLFYAIAAISLDPNPTGTVQLQVSSAAPPQGVGVSMVPNKVPQPNQPAPTAPFLAQLRIRGEDLGKPEQRDLFATILPLNITGSPTLTFTPKSAGGALAVKLTVLDGSNNTLYTFTTQPGQTFVSPVLSNITAANSAGKTVRILVEPLPKQVGDGLYDLELDAPTSDPNPYLFPSPDPGISLLFGPQPANLPFGGSADGNFTSAQPTVQVYKFTLPNLKTPFKVWTEDLDPNTNTAIKLYRGMYNSNGLLIGFVELNPSPSPSFDYFPADRSAIDSQVVVNNYHILDTSYDDTGHPAGTFSKGSGILYVAVRNEQGSTGHYRVHADRVPVSDVGPGTTDPLHFGRIREDLVINPETGTGSFTAVFNTYDLLLNTPHGLTSAQPTLSITAKTTTESVTVTLTDSAGNQVFKQTRAVNANKVASFTLPQLSPSSGYVLNAVSSVAANSVDVVISAQVSTSSAAVKPTPGDEITKIGTPIKPNPPVARVIQAPDGTFVDLGTGLSGTGVLRRLVFEAPASGLSHFSAKFNGISSGSLSLYRASGPGPVEFQEFIGTLLDFDSTAAADGTYSFDDYLIPGTYYLKIEGTGVARSSATISASTAAFNAQHIDLDPQTAQNDASNLRTVDDAFNYYGTEFYELEAPGGVQSSLTVDLSQVINPNGTPSLTNGTVTVAAYKKTVTGYSLLGFTTANYDKSPPDISVPLTTADTPTPGDQYFIGIYRDRELFDLLVGPSFLIPQSGDPNFVAQPIVLLPDNGRTLAEVIVRNQGYASAGSFHGLLTFSNYPTPAMLDLAGIGPFGTVTYMTDWDPDAPANTVSFTADYDNQINETNEKDNSTSVALSSVDAHFPKVNIELKDPSLNGEGAVWGRYVSGVTGVKNDILMTTTDADGDIYKAVVNGPIYGQFIASNQNFASTKVLDLPLDFAQLIPTSQSNTNDFHYSAIDGYGLRTSDHVQKVDVIPTPQFLTSITWDPKAKRYNLDFVHDVVNEQATVSQILGFDVPVVGDKKNQFLVHVEAHGTAGLDPTQAISLPLTAHLLLEAVDSTLYDQTFDGSTMPTDHLTISTHLDIDSRTLDATAASVSAQLQNLSVFHFETPLIKVFSYGISGIASIDAGIKFGLDAHLSAGVKLGIDPNILKDPLSLPSRIGLMSPTYIQPSITGSATVEGDVEVLGFNLASLSGTVSLTIAVTVGLDNNDPSKVFTFDDFFNHLAVKVDAILGIHFEADVIIIGDIWDFDYSHDFPLSDTSSQGIITQDPGDKTRTAAAQIQKAMADPLSVFTDNPKPLPDVPAPVIKHGGDTVGAYKIDPHPQIVIDPKTGNAISVQVRNVSQTPGVTVGNLAVSTRTNAGWQGPITLTSSDVSNPNLALTHDNANSTAAAVVYEAMNAPGTPADKTFNQKLDATDIRFRYSDGSGFGAEQSITNDSLFDSDLSVSFNDKGNGLTAWIHNTSSTPMGADGNYSRSTQDIEAAIWNPVTHTFGAPLAITTPDGAADYNPAAYIDQNGKMYVVWIRGADDQNVLMYSTSTGGAWSAPAVLPVTGLTPGGSFKSLTIGHDLLGHVNVLFSYRDPIAQAGDQVHSFLFNRSTDPSVFGQPTGVEEIDHDANFSHLSTTNAPDGSLVAYWQRGDGVDNNIFYSLLARSPQNPSVPWTTPTQLTHTTDLTMSPSLAVDTNGSMDVLFDTGVPKGGTAAPAPVDPAVGVHLEQGVGSSNIAALPELSFSNGLFFPLTDQAAVGTNALGKATILNSGSVATTVTIDSFAGVPGSGTLINSRQITLGPGHSYDYSQLFPVQAGKQVYSVRVTSSKGEAVTTADDISTAELTGLPEVVIASLTPSVPNPAPGQQITLTADVVNTSTANLTGGFDVQLRSGDPRYPQLGGSIISTVHVSSLGPSTDVKVNFPITLPATAGQYLFAAVADSGHAVNEAVESNNTAQYEVTFAADPAVGIVTAVLNNYSGVQNVTVTASLVNLGNVAVTNVPVHLQVSRDGAPFVDAGIITLASITPQGLANAVFTANGLAGDNIYRAFIDPTVNLADSNVSNNSGQAELFIHGLADLTFGPVALSDPTPRQGGPVTVNGILKNLGIADATNVLIEVFAAPHVGSDVLAVGSIRVPLVPALGQVAFKIPIDTTGLTSQVGFTIRVNRLHEVLESTELNNTFTFVADFGPAIPISNVVNAVPGVANTITFRRDASGLYDDVWVNVPLAGDPTQLLDVAKPSTIGGSGKNDTLVFDNIAGNAIPGAQIVIDGFFTANAFSVGPNQLVKLVNTPSLGPSTLSLNSLKIDSTGTLDIGTGNVQVHYANSSPLTTLAAYIKSGFNGGVFNGHGITTSLGNSSFAVGYSDSGQPGNTVLIKYTRLGDANLDGTVGFADLLRLAQSYNKQAATWDEGDFNFDRAVTFADLLTLAQNYNKGQAAALLAALRTSA